MESMAEVRPGVRFSVKKWNAVAMWAWSQEWFLVTF
jgi:hypothetical protein